MLTIENIQALAGAARIGLKAAADQLKDADIVAIANAIAAGGAEIARLQQVEAEKPRAE